MKPRQFTRTFLIAAAISAVFVMTSHFAAQNVSESELRYREALRKQQVDGDLPAAIKLYQDIVASKTADRVTKAKALLQLAACYDTLGRESQTLYQQIVRDFADQPAASQARKKLDALRPPAAPAGMTMRKIEFSPGLIHATDGQRAIFEQPDNEGTGLSLYIGDLNGKDRKKILTIEQGRIPLGPWLSRDLSVGFLYYPQSQQRPDEYVVFKTDGNVQKIDLSDFRETLPLTRPVCLAWMPDNRHILLCRRRQDQPRHLFKVSIPDGQIVDFVPGWQKDIDGVAASPDGQYIAFSDSTGPIYIMPTAGGEPKLVVETGRLLDWTGDGKYLVFNAYQNKAQAIFAIPIRNGAAAGERIFIRNYDNDSNTQPFISGTSMFFTRGNRVSPKLFFASLDIQDRLTSWKALELVGSPAAFPTWSSDASRFVYVSHTAGERASAVRVYTMATGEDRELFRTKNSLMNCLWASRRPTIYCGQGEKEKTEVLSISADTGRAETLRIFDGTRTLLGLSTDDRFLYMGNLSGPTPFLQWEIGTEHETERPGMLTSADGQWHVMFGRDEAGRREYRVRREGTDTAWKHLVYLSRQFFPFAPDPAKLSRNDNWLFYHDTDALGSNGLYRVSPSGGDPERLGDYPTKLPASFLDISADGRSFLVNTLGPTAEAAPPEFWLLQNFLPTSNGATTTTRPAGKAATK